MEPFTDNPVRIRNKISRIILAILLFILAYLLLLAFSAGLMVLCIYLGIKIITAFVHLVTIAAGIMVMFSGVMIFIFSIKFIFKRYKKDNPYSIEITPKEHPRLFKLIRETADQVGAPYPKKVFLVQGVTACVFYNASILSLFYPVRKNLEIGLGLFSSMNAGELKVVLAHEFGHFSQKSLQFGAYVYKVNQVIQNMVFSNDRWDRTILSLSRTQNIISIFGALVYKIAELIRSGLRKIYELVISSYNDLSRELEFHADQVATAIAGSETSISALRRLTFGSQSFDNMLEKLENLRFQNKIIENLYTALSFEISAMSVYFNLRTENGLPLITDSNIADNTVSSRISYKDHWATHPSHRDREARIRQAARMVEFPDKSSCWDLLDQPETWQQRLTKKYFLAALGTVEGFEVLNDDQYMLYVEEDRKKIQIDRIFLGFYSHRYLHFDDIQKVIELQQNPDPQCNYENELHKIYNLESKRFFLKYYNDIEDLNILNHIKNKVIKTRYFEFDANKYLSEDVDKAIALLEKDIDQTVLECRKLDEKALLLNLEIAGNFSDEKRQWLFNEWKTLREIQAISATHRDYMEKWESQQVGVAQFENIDKYKQQIFIRELSELEESYRNYIRDLALQDYEEIQDNHLKFLKEYFDDKISCIKITSFSPDHYFKLQDLMYSNHSLIDIKFLKKLKYITDYQKNMYEELKIAFDCHPV